MFSADSRWALIRGSQGSEVWDLQAASSPVRAIEPFHAEEARFSPDGRRLISVAERGGPMIIRELAPDGQRKVPVTWSEFHAFSSDGRLLAVDAAAGVALVDMRNLSTRMRVRRERPVNAAGASPVQGGVGTPW
jgi:WD40-like Beta Propeller Repeat